MADMFSIQDDIANRIAVAMQVSLTEGEQAAHRYGTTNLRAWALNLKGNEQISIFQPKPNRKAREYYVAALREDPESAHALAFLALTYFLDVRFGCARHRSGISRGAERQGIGPAFERPVRSGAGGWP
jgi:hypothetical protein